MKKYEFSITNYKLMISFYLNEQEHITFSHKKHFTNIFYIQQFLYPFQLIFAILKG